MKKIQILTVGILSVSLFASVFSACDKKTENTETTTVADTTAIALPTNEEGTAYSLGADGYKYYIYDTPTDETTERTDNAQSSGHTIMSLTTAAKTTKKAENKTDKPSKDNKTTTSKSVSDETVKNKSKGISVLSKTSPVKRGNSASVTIMGQSEKVYSIEFYSDANTVSTTSGLNNKTAGSDGLVTWTFEVGNNCEPGNRKIIIREKGSDNFVQTSITVE